jgi:hypothetical protein
MRVTPDLRANLYETNHKTPISEIWFSGFSVAQYHPFISFWGGRAE